MVSKIPWVKWDVVCKPKNLVGIGICDLRLINLDLLDKLRWRLLSRAFGIRHVILIAKYGPMPISSSSGGRGGCLRLASAWWSGVSFLGAKMDYHAYWFRDGFLKRVDLDLHTSFWNDTWLGVTHLSVSYLRLFSIYDKKYCSVRRLESGRVTLGCVTLNGEENVLLSMSRV